MEFSIIFVFMSRQGDSFACNKPSKEKSSASWANRTNSSAKKVWATGAGSAKPVVSMMMPSKGLPSTRDTSTQIPPKKNGTFTELEKEKYNRKRKFILKCPRSLNSSMSNFLFSFNLWEKFNKSLQKCRCFLAEGLFCFWCSCLPSGLLVQFLETSDKITSYRAANTAIVHLNDVLLTGDCLKKILGTKRTIFNMFFGEISRCQEYLSRTIRHDTHFPFALDSSVTALFVLRRASSIPTSYKTGRVTSETTQHVMCYTRLTKLILNDGNLFSMVDVQDVI